MTRLQCDQGEQRAQAHSDRCRQRIEECFDITPQGAARLERITEYDRRNTSDRCSAYAALISNICERDRAKHVGQFDDILRNFVNETNKYEGRFGENPRLAVRRLMPASLLNYRFRGTTLALVLV